MRPSSLCLADVRERIKTDLLVGTLATATMDAAMLVAGVAGGAAFSSDRLRVGVIGRWAAGLARGRWRLDDTGGCETTRGDAAMGLMAHYLTGTVLTGIFLAIPHRDRRSVVRDAVAYGLATSTLPLLVMFPSLGYGWCGIRSGEAARMCRIMLLGHGAFGLGIGLWAQRVAPGAWTA